jgi:hypothetical protein
MFRLAATPTAAIIVRKKRSGKLHPNGRSLVYLGQYRGNLLLVENAF